MLNAQAGDHDTTIPFTKLSQKIAESLASQAAIALNRQRLIGDLDHLFESFVTLIADAIDEKSPYTGRHCRRVSVLTMMLAEATVATDDGPMASFAMSRKMATSCVLPLCCMIVVRSPRQNGSWTKLPSESVAVAFVMLPPARRYPWRGRNCDVAVDC